MRGHINGAYNPLNTTNSFETVNVKIQNNSKNKPHLLVSPLVKWAQKSISRRSRTLYISTITHSFTSYNLTDAVGSIRILKYSVGRLLTHNKNHPNTHIKSSSHFSIFYSSSLVSVLEISKIEKTHKILEYQINPKRHTDNQKSSEIQNRDDENLFTSWIHLKTAGTSHEPL